MKVVLITPTPPDINAFGIRILSSVLKERGIHTNIVFLPGGVEHLKFDASYIYEYPAAVLDQIADICSDADLVGFSFMSQYFDRVVQLTRHLKSHIRTPIVWGGVHPTYRPEQALDYCDVVCIGEGETALTRIADRIERGADYRDVANCCVRRDGRMVKNPALPLIEDLDALPFVDYDLADHYIYDPLKKAVFRMDPSIMKANFLKMAYFGDRHIYTYRTMTSRGCPHKCAYCASSAMGKLRRRSIDNVIDELKVILNRFDYVGLISFFDDTFFAAPAGYFEEFRDKYKREINLPFHAQCSPTTLDETKMALVSDAGLYHTEMGIQTGSKRIQQIYNRTVPNEKVLAVADILDKYRSSMMPPIYHIILDNPWETAADVRKSLDLLLNLPGRFILNISSLVLYPGTRLNERARAEGVLTDEINEVYRRPFTYPKATYLNYLIYLTGIHQVPRRLIRFLGRDVFVKLFHRQAPSAFVKFLFSATARVQLLGKGLKALLKGDFARIINYFRLIR